MTLCNGAYKRYTGEQELTKKKKKTTRNHDRAVSKICGFWIRKIKGILEIIRISTALNAKLDKKICQMLEKLGRL
jgi:hypothetical protein